LTGRIFDDGGNRMSPSHSRKGAKRHRYYVSPALIQGRPQTARSVARSGGQDQGHYAGAVRGHIGPDAPGDDAELITTCVHRIEVRRTEIAVSLLSEDRASNGDTTPSVLTVPWSKTPHRRRRDVIAPRGASPAALLPIRADVRVKLVTAIARGRQWLSEIETGTATVDGIAAREACSKRHVGMTISLAFLAPTRPLSMVGCRAESVSPASSMHRSHGRVSIRCWGSHTDGAFHAAGHPPSIIVRLAGAVGIVLSAALPPGSPACSMRQSRGRVSISCSVSPADATRST
jgi:hypothetical protein